MTLYPDMYARRAAEPFVAHTLHMISEKFDCEREWRGLDGDRYVSLAATPLLPDAQAGFGYGNRTGPSFTVDTSADLAYGEHTWKIVTPNHMWQGSHDGIVSLLSHVRARFEVPRSISYNFTTDDGRPQYDIVCRAQAYMLPNGSECIALDTFIGRMWLQPLRTDTWHALLRAVQHQTLQPVSISVFRITAIEFSQKHPMHPWQGLSSTDASGRDWTIQKSELTISASLLPQQTAPVDTQLYKIAPEATKLEPPYDIVWQPTVSVAGEVSALVPLVFE